METSPNPNQPTLRKMSDAERAIMDSMVEDWLKAIQADLPANARFRYEKALNFYVTATGDKGMKTDHFLWD